MPWNALTAKDAFFSNSSVHAFQADPALVKKGEIQSRRYQFYHIMHLSPELSTSGQIPYTKRKTSIGKVVDGTKNRKLKLEVELHFLQTDRRI